MWSVKNSFSWHDMAPFKKVLWKTCTHCASIAMSLRVWLNYVTHAISHDFWAHWIDWLFSSINLIFCTIISPSNGESLLRKSNKEQHRKTAIRLIKFHGVYLFPLEFIIYLCIRQFPYWWAFVKAFFRCLHVTQEKSLQKFWVIKMFCRCSVLVQVANGRSYLYHYGNYFETYREKSSANQQCSTGMVIDTFRKSMQAIFMYI